MFPLSVQSGVRHLVTASGGAFLLHADISGAMTTNLTREDAVQYLDDRRARNYTTIIDSVIEHTFARNAPANIYGDQPFTTPGDFTTPNEPYWQHVDYVLDRAAERGFLMIMVTAWHGVNGGSEGWYSQLVANGATKLRTYGRFLGQRYARFNNILWLQGGDYNPPDKTLARAIALGINDFIPNALQSAHCARGTSPLDYWRGESWLNVNNVYTGSSVAVASRAQYAQPEQMPFFLAEAYFEGTATVMDFRTYAYHALLSGGCGEASANDAVLNFDWDSTAGQWKSHLDSPGSRSMTQLYALFSSVRWDLLMPDTTHVFLTGSIQTGQAEAVAAVASDRSFGMCYAPTGRTLTVDLTKLAGPNVTARWFNPATGAFTTISGSPFAANSTRSFATPAGGTNQPDWVLLLQSS